jgi:tight adherence protein B
VTVASIAALCALGVIVLSGGVYRLSRRAVTARRVAALLADEARPSLEAARPARAAPWRGELRQMLAQLEARGSTLRGPFVVLACVCGLFGLASVSAVWLGLALVSGVIAYGLGGRERRRERLEAQSLDAMGLLASGLRAGYSVPQAITLVARHSPQPTASEFGLAAQEISVGVKLGDAMARLARRNANPDYALVAIIIRVQHEVGGNLAQILESVSNTLRERLELRRQVNALTAQQRLSSIVLTVLPFALLTVLSLMDRSFVEPLFSETIGRLMLAISAVMVLIGWTIMRSIGRVEV